MTEGLLDIADGPKLRLKSIGPYFGIEWNRIEMCQILNNFSRVSWLASTR